MQLHLRGRDWLVVVAAASAAGAAALLPWRYGALAGVAAGAAVAAGLIVAIQLEVYRRLQFPSRREARKAALHQLARQNYRQTEALFSLFSILKIRHPLPPMRDWAISPDFANLIVSTMLQRRPRLVVEASSGVSTLIVAYLLQEQGFGRLVSLEDVELFARNAQAGLERHGLADWGRAVFAPLKEYKADNQTLLWYDVTQLPADQPIDLLIVDGPPEHGRPLARYPAVPLLADRLGRDAVILADDADRPGEREMVRRWLREHDWLELEQVECEKGAAVLRRKPS